MVRATQANSDISRVTPILVCTRTLKGSHGGFGHRKPTARPMDSVYKEHPFFSEEKIVFNKSLRESGKNFELPLRIYQKCHDNHLCNSGFVKCIFWLTPFRSYRSCLVLFWVLWQGKFPLTMALPPLYPHPDSKTFFGYINTYIPKVVRGRG